MNWDRLSNNLNARFHVGPEIRIPIPPALAPAIEVYLRLKFGEPDRFANGYKPRLYGYGWPMHLTYMDVMVYADGWLEITQDGSWATEPQTKGHFAEVWDILINWLMTWGEP